MRERTVSIRDRQMRDLSKGHRHFSCTSASPHSSVLIVFRPYSLFIAPEVSHQLNHLSLVKKMTLKHVWKTCAPVGCMIVDSQPRISKFHGEKIPQPQLKFPCTQRSLAVKVKSLKILIQCGKKCMCAMRNQKLTKMGKTCGKWSKLGLILVNVFVACVVWKH